MELAKKQREISVAEFFEKNRHLLGFDNKKKALLTTVKEAVDNSLDACEEARILPEIDVEVIDMNPKVKVEEGQTTLNGNAPKHTSDRFRVIIEDNGIGMDRETQEKAFSLFFSSKGAKGTGLGLFIANKITNSHGGSIELNSEDGKGSSFTVIIPREKQPTDSEISEQLEGGRNDR